MMVYCDFCCNVINSLSECVAYRVRYNTIPEGLEGEFIIYIHEHCFNDPKFKGRADVFREHAELIE